MKGPVLMALSRPSLVGTSRDLPPPGLSRVVCACVLSRVQLFATPWTAACQAPLPIALSRQEYWSGLPFPTPGDLPDPGIEPASPRLAGRFFTAEPLWKPQQGLYAASQLTCNYSHFCESLGRHCWDRVSLCLT